MEPKKNTPYDLGKKRKFHLAIGFIISLSLITVAFEWRTPIEPIEIPLHPATEEAVLPPIPPTTHEPPKPKIQPVVVSVPDDQEVEVDVEFILDVQIDDEIIAEYVDHALPPEESIDDVLIFAETQPSFPGGLEAFYRYVGQSVHYPRQAVQRGVSGKVFIEFVVDKDGSLSDIRVAKGIGAGCDEEALRVIKNAPRWNPGKQRGRAVRVRMMVPITFSLQ